MALLIRPAEMSDLAAVLNVGRRTWPATYGPVAGDEYVEMGLAKWWTEDATTPSIRAGRVTVAELDGEVVGIAAAGMHEKHLTLWKLYVLPEHQGKAIGSALLQAVEDRARADNHPDIRLSYLDGSTGAERFYRSKGFVETGRESSGEGIPESVWMELALDPKEQT